MVRKLAEIPGREVPGYRDGKGTAIARNFLKAEDFKNGAKSSGRVILPPGATIGYHQHVGESETYFIVKGHGIFHDNGKDVPVTAGDVAIINGGEYHGLDNAGDSDLELITLVTVDRA